MISWRCPHVPSPLHSEATACALAPCLSATMNRAPSSANIRDVARPIPEPPTVMMQILSFRRHGHAHLRHCQS
jgi:hypothetical protein